MRPLARIVPLRRPGIAVSELGDDALMAAVATADPVACAALFEHNVDAIYRFVARMWRGNADAVDDLVQATFLAAFRSVARFRPGGRIRSWLYGIAANIVRDHARREGRRLRAMSTVASWFRGEPAVAIDPWDRERLARLPEAIDGLPHDLKAVLVLVDLEGLSTREAATALDVPEGTIWRRIYHARRRVRARVDEGHR